MDHSRAQELISERMDGERLPSRVTTALEQHLEHCAECRAFEGGAFTIREWARFEVAPAVPDLVDRIVARAAEERPARPRLRPVRPRPFRSRSRFATIAPAVAALLVGALVGSLVVGGPFARPQRQEAIAATEISQGVARAAASLTAYQATYQITERHFSPEVPVRELSMNVWFRAPERFRLDVVDHTVYPTMDQSPTDMQLVVNGSSWATTGSAPCGLARCAERRTVVHHRAPFSSATPVPTDLVLPVTTLSDPSAVRVIGSGTVLGRTAVEVELPFDRAGPLFPFLQLGGSWRPFYPNDRVVLWLDRTDWVPLRWSVYPAGGHARDEWALRFGLPNEPSRRAIFEVSALSVLRRKPTPGTFAIPRSGPAEDAGATRTTLTNVLARTGQQPITPGEVAGLPLYRVVVAPQAADQTVIAYAKGVSWLKLGETRNWTEDALFGPVGLHAQQVELPNGGVGYYEPATDDHGRRLSIHAPGADLYLETNLSREHLLSVAASLPLQGTPIPEAWARSADSVRVSLERAAAMLPFPLLQPQRLPAGYAFASAELVRVGRQVGVTLYYQQLSAELGAGPIRFHVEPADSLPPASSARQDVVDVLGAPGRWTPDRNQLEWFRDGVYYSLDGTGLDLPTLLEVADSVGLQPSAVASP